MPTPVQDASSGPAQVIDSYVHSCSVVRRICSCFSVHDFSFRAAPRRFRSALTSIKDFGIGLHSIKILVKNTWPPRIGFSHKYQYRADIMISDIIEGCPKLKTLTLEPLERGRDLTIERNCLEKLLKSGKELETLRVIKGYFPDLFNEKEVKEILPTCNVEMEECKFTQGSSAYKSPFVTLYHVYDSD